MLDKRAKGISLEDYVATQFRRIDKYAYRRKDSGSGKLRKEDVFTTLPFFIECKNQTQKNIQLWFTKAEMDTPGDKYTLLIYKGLGQHGATVYMRVRSFLGLLSGVKIEGLGMMMSMELEDFISLLEEKYVQTQLAVNGIV